MAYTVLNDNITSTSFEDTSVVQGRSYNYIVTAYNEAGWGPDSAPDAGYSIPVAPTGLTASKGTYTNKISLSWNSVTDATSYKIFRNGSEIQTQSGTTYDVATGCSEGVDYTFVVQAYVYGHWSGNSSSDSGWVKPASVTGISVSNNLTTKVRIDWNAITSTIFRVYRNSSVLGTSSGSSTYYEDTTALAGVDYTYKVEREAGSHVSDQSSQYSGYRKMSTPASLNASNLTYTNKIRLTWNTSSDAYSYIIKKSDDSVVGEIMAPTLFYDDTTITPGQSYSYKICSKGANNTYSDDSSLVSGMAELENISSASGSQGTEYDTINVQWVANTYANCYKVERKLGAGSWSDISGVITNTNYPDATADVGSVYTYRVFCSSNGGSHWSPIGNETTGYRRVHHPSTVNVTQNRADGVLITWQPVANAIKYKVFRTNPTDSGELEPNINEWLDASALPNNAYYYYVDAKVGDLWSRSDNEILGYRTLPSALRGMTQIKEETIRNPQISHIIPELNPGVALNKLEDYDKLFFHDGTRQMTDNLSVGNNKIINLAHGSLPTDAATKYQLDYLVSKLKFRQSVRTATTEDLSSKNLNEFVPGLSVGGVTISLNDRILIKDLTNSILNGIYDITNSGAVRSSDCDGTTDAEVSSGIFCFVEEGIYKSVGFILATPDPISLGTTNLTFSQFNGAGQITAGMGIKKYPALNNKVIIDSGTGIMALTSDDLDDAKKLEIDVDRNIDTNYGLQKGGTNNNLIQINLDENSGLTFGTTGGLKCDLKLFGGLEFDEDACLTLQHNIGGDGLDFSNNVLKVKLDSYQWALYFDGGKLRIDPLNLFDDNYGLDIRGDLIIINLKAYPFTDDTKGFKFGATSALSINLSSYSGLSLTNNGLSIHPDFAREGLEFVDGILNVVFVRYIIPSGTIDGINDSFAVPYSVIGGSIRVFKNGLLQDLTADYIYDYNNNMLEMINVPEVGTNLQIIFIEDKWS